MCCNIMCCGMDSVFFEWILHRNTLVTFFFSFHQKYVLADIFPAKCGGLLLLFFFLRILRSVNLKEKKTHFIRFSWTTGTCVLNLIFEMHQKLHFHTLNKFITNYSLQHHSQNKLISKQQQNWEKKWNKWNSFVYCWTYPK